MPITQDKHLALLGAAEDALQALDVMETFIGSQLALARASGNWQQLFEELALMGQAGLFLKNPIGTRVTVQIEREFYSNTRIGINRRAKKAQERRRARAASGGRGGGESISDSE